jgi:hypothetical protein
VAATAAIFASDRAAEAAHGDNMGCIGCAITMEHAFEKVARYANERGLKMSLTEQATEQVNMAELFHGLRDEVPAYLQYSARVGSTATEMTTRWSNVMAAAYAGNEPVETDVYNKTHFVCVKQLDYCDDQPVPPATMFRDKCEACKAVVADIAMVVYRKKAGWELYRTKTHVYEVLDRACTSSVLRIPPSLHGRFSSSCDDIVEEYEHEIADAIIADPESSVEAVCGPAVAAACAKDHDQYHKAWLSPFHQVPYRDVMFLNSAEAPPAEL